MTSKRPNRIYYVSATGIPRKNIAIAFYALKPCTYWNSHTLDTIVEHGNGFFIEAVKFQGKFNELPQAVQIYDANINVNFVLRSKGTMIV